MSADTLLLKYERAYHSIHSSFRAESINALITSDASCLVQLGKGKVPSSFACEYCDLIGHLVDLRKGIPSEVKIDVGDLRNKTFKIVVHESPVVMAKVDSRVRELHLQYAQKHKQDTQDIADQYITVDSWANDVIIQWLLHRAYTEAGIQHIIPAFGMFVCQDRGYKIVTNDSLNITDLKLNENSAFELLYELGTALRIIRHYNFLLPNATILNLSYTNEPIAYTYRSIVVNSSFSLFLKDFSSASIEWDDIRIVPYAKGHHIDINRAAQNESVVLQYKQAIIKDQKVQLEPLFKIQSHNIGLFLSLRHSGYPLYAGTYDYYAILISLLSWKHFRDIVNSSDRLQKYIQKLFPKKDFLKFWPSSEETSLLTCPREIAKLLCNVYLYEDVFDRILDV